VISKKNVNFNFTHKTNTHIHLNPWSLRPITCPNYAHKHVDFFCLTHKAWTAPCCAFADAPNWLEQLPAVPSLRMQQIGRANTHSEEERWASKTCCCLKLGPCA
jgi:hypothetical protein